MALSEAVPESDAVPGLPNSVERRDSDRYTAWPQQWMITANDTRIQRIGYDHPGGVRRPI